MSAERIVQTLLDGDMSPEKFMAGLPSSFWSQFRVVPPSVTGEGTKVYLQGQHGQAFLGWIQNMGDNMWYAWRAAASDGTHDVNGPYHTSPEEAAQDLLSAMEFYDSGGGRGRLTGEAKEMDPARFMKRLPKSFWASFHVIKSGEESVYAEAPYRNSSYLVYFNRPGERNAAGGQIRDFIGLITQNTEGLWEVVRVASPHMTKPGHGTYLRPPVTYDADQLAYEDREDVVSALYADYLTEK